VIGTGPAALITVIHCTENVLMTGGVMKLFESREDSSAGETLFDWAQIVRLDARWIGMLRYYLGIGFEDTFIPGKSIDNLSSLMCIECSYSPTCYRLNSFG
jgi:hypothetical protein